MVIAAATGGAGYLIGRGDVSPPAQPLPEIEVKPVGPTVPAVTDVALERADIIRLGNEAADAASGGPAIGDPLDGRRFVVRIPFGCEATDPQMAGDGATFSVDDRALRLRVQPLDWVKLPWIKNELSNRDAIAAEGFWIPRPWTRSDTCLAGTADPADRGSWLGIAQLFDSESSRVGQRQRRALEATIPIDADDADVSKGLTMVLTGRVARWPGRGETVLCNAAQPSQRPTCLVGAKLDSISIENAVSGDRLADWQF